MRKHLLAFTLSLSAALLIGCGGAPSGGTASLSGNSRAEIQAAVDAHLAKRTDLALGDMDVTVKSVEFNGDEAEAVVGFRASGAAEEAMSMTYQLTRTDAGWQVKPKEGMGGHGGIMPPPSAEDPNLPPGHPPTTGGAQSGGVQSGGAGAQELPQGHPPVAQ